MDTEKRQKLQQLLVDQKIDVLLLGGNYNIQYATDVQIDVAHAQLDLVMFAAVTSEGVTLFVPHCWQSTAQAAARNVNVIAYASDRRPLDAAIEAVLLWAQPVAKVGSDGDAMRGAVRRRLGQACAEREMELVECGALVAAARAIKTAREVRLLDRIAYKTDHVINGHFHHLIADRPKSAASISESLRVHSSERDIPIAGYHASARAVLGDSNAQFWAYAPVFGFASTEMCERGDIIVADMMCCEDGYWSNAVRIAIAEDDVDEEQGAAYAALNRLRAMLLDGLEIGRTCADIYRDVVQQARDEGLALVTQLPLGFCVGVSAMEGPYVSAGEEQLIAAGMVMVLDPVVQHGGRFYRSRDTVVIGNDGPQIVNWYKDWREPYLAIPEI